MGKQRSVKGILPRYRSFLFGSAVLVSSLSALAQSDFKYMTLEDLGREKFSIREENIRKQSFIKHVLPGGSPVIETVWEGTMVVTRDTDRSCWRINQSILEITKSPVPGSELQVELPKTHATAVFC